MKMASYFFKFSPIGLAVMLIAGGHSFAVPLVDGSGKSIKTKDTFNSCFRPDETTHYYRVSGEPCDIGDFMAIVCYRADGSVFAPPPGKRNQRRACRDAGGSMLDPAELQKVK